MRLLNAITTLVAGAGLLALGLNAYGAAAPIQNSLHNMNYVFGANTIQDNQICLPCHAPHSQQATPQDYLWNHKMPTTSYKMYAAGTNVGLDSASKMCLSCHDGTVAVDSYYSVFGANVTGNTTLHQGSHTLGSTQSDNLGNSSTAGFVMGGGTGDLSHDHPVGIVYPGLSTSGTWTSSRGFKDPTKFNTSTYYSAIQNPDGSYVTAHYVDSAGTTNITATGGGSISLQKQSASDTVGTVIGCVACHTPHTNTYNFLHIPNTNSQLCLTCHDK